MTTFYIHTPAHLDVASMLRTIGERIEQEARLSEEKARNPSHFTDEILVAILEIARRVGFTAMGGDPRICGWTREEAAEWLDDCLHEPPDDELQRIQSKVAQLLLAELRTP